MERVVPDAITTSILLLVLMFVLSLFVGTDVPAAMDAYYRGLWNLLTFLSLMLAGWLYQHFYVRQLSLDIN